MPMLPALRSTRVAEVPPCRAAPRDRAADRTAAGRPCAGPAGGSGRRARAGGFTLVEVMVVCTILAIALVMLSGTVASTSRLVPSTQESYSACLGAANTIEAMHNEDPAQLWALFNGLPDDDPGGPGTAPGSSFAVADLALLPGDPDGRAGEVLVPELEGQLREDQVEPLLGLPRDLNGDSKIDSLDHADDWLVLPVVVRVRWQGLNGPREFSLATMLTRER